MRTFALLVLVVAFGWNSGASAVPIQWTIGEGGNGHWYEAVDVGSRVYWQDAEVLSENAGGYLATITSEDEDLWVNSNLLHLVTGTGDDGVLGPWIGGYQDINSPLYSEPAGGWGWVTNEPWSYTSWGSKFGGIVDEPNNNPAPESYLHYYLTGTPTDRYGWNDLGDSPSNAAINSYLIEYDNNPIPEPSTALLLGVGLAGLGMRRRTRSGC